MDTILKIRRVRDCAVLPHRASAGAAAYDLAAAIEQPVVIAPGAYASIPAGIAIELPSADLVALIFSRSGQGCKHGVSLVNSVGVIDSDYRGEISIGLINHGNAPYIVSPGDRIAQLMVTHALPLTLQECETLSDTARGVSGFGSTGLR